MRAGVNSPCLWPLWLPLTGRKSRFSFTDPSDWKGERWFVSSRQPTDELLTCTGWIPPTFHIVSWKRRMMINLLYGCETLFITSNSVFQKCVSSRNTSLNENSIPFFCWSRLIRINEVFVSVGSYVFSSVLQGWWNWVTLYGGHQWFLVSPLVAYRLCLRSLWFMSPLWQTDGLTCCLIAYWCNHTGRSYLLARITVWTLSIRWLSPLRTSFPHLKKGSVTTFGQHFLSHFKFSGIPQTDRGWRGPSCCIANVADRLPGL